MNYYAILTIVNMVAAAGYMISSTNTEYPIQPGLAKLAVSQQLEQIPSASRLAAVPAKRSCVEQSEIGSAIVTAQRELTTVDSSVDGVPVNQITSMSYEADVRDECGTFNPNCYFVRDLVVDGVQSTVPRL